MRCCTANPWSSGDSRDSDEQKSAVLGSKSMAAMAMAMVVDAGIWARRRSGEGVGLRPRAIHHMGMVKFAKRLGRCAFKPLWLVYHVIVWET